MLAAQYNEIITDVADFDKKIQLVQVPKPDSVPEGHALVCVHAASVNPIDWMVMAGLVQDFGWELPLPFTIGYDFSGTIELIGGSSSSNNFQVGDEVFAVNWGKGNHNTTPMIGGAFQEYIVVSLEKLSKKLPSVSHEQAAAVALVGTTAYQGLQHCSVTKDSKVLVLGGSSAVGSMAIQLAKEAGAWVATTASARTKEYVESFQAADLIIDYGVQKWEEREELKGIDAVFDTVGETNGFARAKTILKEDGAFATTANPEAGFDHKGHPPLTFASYFVLSNDSSVQDKLMSMLADGTLKLNIEKTFPFTQEGVVALMKTQKEGKNKGKLVLNVAK